ncbi:MIIP protein, partial [Polyodon spathula]|nr:MIIP protein [Polyodon spathula]
DWIAGVLDADSSLSEKSEPFFTELRDFRQVNREECVHKEYMEVTPERSRTRPGARLHPVSIRVTPERSRTRPGARLHPVSIRVTPERSRTRPGARLHPEPAFIRVSIPRSTLLPAYRYKAHRRKSFDPSDSLALPSHCLSGWSSTAPPAAPSMNSLDLKTSVKPETAGSDCSLSRVMGGAHTDQLLDLSRSARYHFQRLDQDQNQELRRSKPHSTAYPVY